MSGDHGHGSFRGYAINISPDIAIEHYITDDEDFKFIKVVEYLLILTQASLANAFLMRVIASINSFSEAA